MFRLSVCPVAMLAATPSLQQTETPREIVAGAFDALGGEVEEVVRRERLDVERVFGFRLGVTPWREIEAAISCAGSSSSAR
jgi:hypothetical protein